MGKRSCGSYRRTLRKRIVWLGKVMKKGVVDQIWENFEDYAVTNKIIQKLYGAACKLQIDTMPIRCNRPKNKKWRLAMYSGKYKATVLKVEVCCNHAGLPVYYSHTRYWHDGRHRHFKNVWP